MSPCHTAALPPTPLVSLFLRNQTTEANKEGHMQECSLKWVSRLPFPLLKCAAKKKKMEEKKIFPKILLARLFFKEKKK